MGNTSSQSELYGATQTLLEDGLDVDSQIWNLFWRYSGPAEAFRLCFSQKLLRGLVQIRPKELNILLLKSLKALQKCLDYDSETNEADFDESDALKTSFEQHIQAALNAVQILTYTLPVCFEAISAKGDWDEDIRENVSSMFWDSNRYNKSTSFAEALISTIGRLFFLPGLTLPKHVARPSYEDYVKSLESIKYEGGLDQSCQRDEGAGESGDTAKLLDSTGYRKEWVWFKGIESEFSRKDDDHQLNVNRRNVLRLFLVCLSEILYLPAEYSVLQRCRWTMAAIQPVDFSSMDSLSINPGMPFKKELFFSLLNTALLCDPVGWRIPYKSMNEKAIVNSELSGSSLLCLLALLQFESSKNEFFLILKHLDCDDQYRFVFDNLVRLLSTGPASSTAIIRASFKGTENAKELLVLVLYLISHNKGFLEFALEQDVMQIIRPLYFFMWASRKDVRRVWLIQTCTLVLLLLSGERRFGIDLNTPCSGALHLEGSPSMVHSTHADYLVLVISELMFDGIQELDVFYNCFATIICNVSPYIKSFNHIASKSLVRLLKRVGSKSFIFSSPQNPMVLSYLLSSFDNFIQYQFEGNISLMYELCRCSSTLKCLLKMELDDEEKPLNSEPTVEEKFTPTKEWFQDWKSNLRIGNLMRVVDVIEPKIESLLKKGVVEEKDIVHSLQDTIMVGLLPAPHSIVSRQFEWNEETKVWFISLIWGSVFIRNIGIGLWDNRYLQLFSIGRISR